MVTQLILPPALEPHWREKIERQLGLTLASVHWQLKRLELVFDRDDAKTSTVNGDAAYICRLEARLRSGRALAFAVKNRDLQACTADIAARLRREINRDKQLGLLGRVG